MPFVAGRLVRPDLTFPVGILLASLVGAASSDGVAHQGFFAATAQIAPVLLIALFVEVATEMQTRRAYWQSLAEYVETLGQEAEPLTPEEIAKIDRFDRDRLQLRSAVLYSVILGGTASLIALAGDPTTFLTVATGVSLAFAAMALMTMFIRRVSPANLAPLDRGAVPRTGPR